MTEGSHTHGVPVLVQISIGVCSILLARIHDIVPILDLWIGLGAKFMSLIGSISLLLINREKIWSSIKILFTPGNKDSKPSKEE